MEINNIENYQLLKGINGVNACLLTEEDTDTALQKALGIIGEALNVDRVYIFRNHISKKQKILVSQEFEWTQENITPQINNGDLQNFSYFNNGFARWWKELSEGKSIKGSIDELPEEEQDVLASQKIMSLIVVPIFVHKNFWGFIGFDDCTKEREWKEIEESTLFNIAQSIGGLLAREVTKNKLIENQKFINSVADTSPNVIYVYDHENEKLIYVSKQVTELFGYRISELKALGREILQLMHPDDMVQVKKFGEEIKTAEDGVIYELVFRFKHKLGHWVWLFNKNTVFKKNDKGKVIQTIGVTEDITKKKESEDKIRESQQLLASINHNIREGIFRTSMEGKILYANKACLDILGYDNFDEFQGINISQFYADEASREKFMQEVINNGSINNCEVKAVRKDGNEIWLLGSSILVTDNEGNNCFDSAIRDITEKKLADERLKKVNEELDRFVYSASHDLRAPLASLSGLIHLVKQEKDPVLLNQYIELMEKSVRRLDEFIREIVNYSRNTRQEIAHDNIILPDLVFEIWEELKNMGNAVKISFSNHIDQTTTFISDQRRIQVILKNLLSNAIKYANLNQKEPFISVKGSVDEQKATIEVCDNGQGIEDAHVDKVFNMFFSAGKSENSSGLGLYIVKETLDKLGGSIEMDTVYKQGTCFKLVFPNLHQ